MKTKTIHFTSVLLAALLTVASGADARPNRSQVSRGVPGQFDYYAVALSWSPSYCAARKDPDQCAPGRQLGFVLHGLWPQYAKGYPQSCSTERLPGDVRGKYHLLFPSEKMIEHEWKKHGTCSGLDAGAYFALSAKMKDQIVIPRVLQQPPQPVRMSPGELVQAFKSANAGMAVNSVLPFCADGGRFLREVQVCYDKAGASTACNDGEVKRAANSCRQQNFLVQSVR